MTRDWLDPDSVGLIDPAAVLPGVALPRRLVICFFAEAVAERCTDGDVPVRLGSEDGPRAVHRVDHGGEEVAIVHGRVGAPNAAMLLEEASALGVRQVVVCGGAGALVDLPVGHVVLPTGAVREEGTSHHYLPPDAVVAPHAAALDALRSAVRARGLAVSEGLTWTTDAPYRETTARVAHHRRAGCLTVEMEAAALFAVAACRDVALGQVLYAGDTLAGEVWDEREWTRHEVRSTLLDIALDAVVAW